MDETENKYKVPKGWGARHTIAIMAFWAFAMSYAMRFNLSLAIVAMVKPPSTSGENKVVHAETTCPHLATNNGNYTEDDPDSDLSIQGEFEWTERQQGVILESFFWGYVLTQLPGGILAHKFGAKWPLGFGLLLTAIFALLTPWFSRIDARLLMFARAVQGLGEGVTFPAMHAMLAEWAPVQERGLLSSIAYAGCIKNGSDSQAFEIAGAQFGTAATMIIGGYLIDKGVLGGWPSIFYVPGIVTIIWFILWTQLVYSSPLTHPRISKNEKQYLEHSIGRKKASVKRPTPWFSFLTSLPLWAIVLANIGQVYGLYTLLTLLPKYLHSVLHFDIKANSWLSAFPYIIMWVASVSITYFSDMLIRKNLVSVVKVRKSCNTIAHLGSALALIGAAHSGCDRLSTILFLALSVGVNGAVYGGCVVNHVDIAPNHAGVLMGITNTVGNLIGAQAPYVAGVILNNNVRGTRMSQTSLESWMYIFYIAAVIYFVDVIFYLIFASQEQQSWDDPKQKRNDISLDNI